MATMAFNQLDDLLNGKRAQDSLAAGAQGQTQSNPEMPGYSQGGQTESAGFAGGSGGTQKFASGPKAKDPMAIIEANKGAQALNLAADATKNVQKATEGLQSQANDYASKVNAASSKPLERSALDDLFSGGGNAANSAKAVRSRLDEQFKADDLNLDTKEAWDAAAFTDPGKLKALRRETGNKQFAGGYSSGMQALDEAVEKQTPQDYSGVLNATQDFRTKAQKAQDEGKAAKSAAQAKWEAETQGIRSSLSGRASELENELATRLQGQTAKDKAEADRLRAEAIAKQRKDAGVDSLKTKLGEYKNLKTPVLPGVSAVGDVSPIEAELAALDRDIAAGKFVATNAPNRTRDDVANDQERTSFNLINELLGQGSRLGQGMIQGPTVQAQDVMSPSQKIASALESLFSQRAAANQKFVEAQAKTEANNKAAAANPTTKDPGKPMPAGNVSGTVSAPGPVEPGTNPAPRGEQGPLTGKQPENPKNTDLNKKGGDTVSPVAKPIVKATDYIAKKFGWG